MTSEELELLTDIRDFNTLFYVILRRESSELFESSIESDDLEYGALAFISLFFLLQTLFLV